MALPPKFSLSDLQAPPSSGLDALFRREPQLVTPAKSRVRVASLSQLEGFQRLSTETLIHKSDRDLWSVNREADGSLVIERMFSDDGTPLKG